MQEIIDYVVVEKGSRHDFQKKVLELIEKGWQPLGGVSYDSQGLSYLQAMILYRR